jgi:hypothetical protein
MVQAIYIPKKRGIYAKAHIQMLKETSKPIKVYDVDPFTDKKTGKEYFRMVLAGPPASVKEIVSMTAEYYNPTQKLKAVALRL